MAHCISSPAEQVLDKEIKVLDRGFVRLVDYMGSDERIVQAARVSYGKGTKSVREDAGLIDYLLRHQHTSPFEHVMLEFHCKLPIFVARQWIRHRTASVNEISGRYSIMTPDYYCPPEEQIRFQSTDNKQGRSNDEVPPELRQKVLDLIHQDQSAVYSSYETLLNDGIAKELARINLPLSLYTEWYWLMDLHNLFHFLRLRMDSHAQWEIRAYANAIAELTQTVVPQSYQSFERHILHGKKFSSIEMDAIHALLNGEKNPLKGHIRDEFDKKMHRATQENL